MLHYIKAVQSTKVHIIPRVISKIWLYYRDFQLFNMSSGLEYIRGHNYSVVLLYFHLCRWALLEYIYTLSNRKLLVKNKLMRTTCGLAI